MYSLNMSKEEFFENLQLLIDNIIYCEKFQEEDNYFLIKEMREVIEDFGLEDICRIYDDGTGICRK